MGVSVYLFYFVIEWEGLPRALRVSWSWFLMKEWFWLSKRVELGLDRWKCDLKTKKWDRVIIKNLDLDLDFWVEGVGLIEEIKNAHKKVKVR